MKKIIAGVMAACLLTTGVQAEYDPQEVKQAANLDAMDISESVFEEEEGLQASLEVSAPSAILMEKTTGTVIFEKNADEQMLPASVTKIMSILLIAEAVDRGELTLDETVSVSKTAADMGGSQVYLEEGEIMAVGELLKCMVVASANDASVAMAEKLSGTEEAFAAKMNQRAAELGMKNTHFTNCSGLWEDDTHVTTARDVAIMSRELLTHDWIRQYTTLWTDTIREGEFGLTNTNKLIRYYEGATGLKTGYTDKAKYCLSGTAERDGVEYIAVVLGCESSEARFESVKKMLSFAFANYALYSASENENLPAVEVKMGKSDFVVPIQPAGQSLLVSKSKVGEIICEVEMEESVEAPVRADTVVGRRILKDGNQIVSEMPILAGTDIQRASFWDLWKENITWLFAGNRGQ